MSTHGPEDWLTPARAADLLALSPDRLRQLARDGRLVVRVDERGHREYEGESVRAEVRARRSARHLLRLS